MTPQGAAPDRYALVGHPVSHSWSPFIHGLFARQTGQNMQYRLLDVPPERFRAEVVQFFVGGGRGLNVTVPHKPAAAEIVSELTPRATLARAVNTIRVKGSSLGLVGDNTDGVGLVVDLTENLGLALAGRRLLILGAGGATRGVLGPLLAQQPATLVIANRTVARAEELVAEFGSSGPVSACGFADVEQRPFDLVINATSASLQGEVPAIPAGAIDATTVCYDMAYAKGDTPFTLWARERHAGATHKGWGMLVEQAAEAFLVWRGVRPQTRPVLELLKAGGADRNVGGH
ncbi:MAG: shikimate dehydrogenase [Steroidobacteraceae bacterium]|jgi:shikimate dehydrogenase|nr:shikimate dehydrogenase [Steroidobacteraceae bacterium]